MLNNQFGKGEKFNFDILILEIIFFFNLIIKLINVVVFDFIQCCGV